MGKGGHAGQEGINICGKQGTVNGASYEVFRHKGGCIAFTDPENPPVLIQKAPGKAGRCLA